MTFPRPFRCEIPRSSSPYYGLRFQLKILAFYQILFFVGVLWLLEWRSQTHLLIHAQQRILFKKKLLTLYRRENDDDMLLPFQNAVISLAKGVMISKNCEPILRASKSLLKIKLSLSLFRGTLSPLPESFQGSLESVGLLAKSVSF